MNDEKEDADSRYRRYREDLSVDDMASRLADAEVENEELKERWEKLRVALVAKEKKSIEMSLASKPRSKVRAAFTIGGNAYARALVEMRKLEKT